MAHIIADPEWDASQQLPAVNPTLCPREDIAAGPLNMTPPPLIQKSEAYAKVLIKRTVLLACHWLALVKSFKL